MDYNTLYPHVTTDKECVSVYSLVTGMCQCVSSCDREYEVTVCILL